MDNVTTIEQLKEYSKGKVVELPPFAEGQRFFARLKRPSLLNMVKNGMIRNELLTKTNELFWDSNKVDLKDSDLLSGVFDILDVIARDTFVEPSYDEIVKNGIQLTDDQLMFIFNYCQQGVKSLENFRTKPENRECASNVEGVSLPSF